jgi:phosphohistidine swiveling domain-containing protein
MADPQAQPKPYETAADFPVTWDDPGDAHLPLDQDRLHAPTPITPLSGWLGQYHWGRGSSDGLAAGNQPLAMHVRRVNTYYYMGVTPSIPMEEMAEAGKIAEASLKAAIPTFADRWTNEWLPEVRGYHDKWNAFDLPAASDAELLDHLTWTTDTFARLWSIHFQLLIPALVGPSMLQDLYVDLFEDSDPMEAYKLAQGFDNSSLRAGEDLWKLSQTVQNSDEIKSILENTPTNEVMATLEKSDAGKQLIQGISAYAQAWGRRSDTVIEIADPSWIEDPTIVIENLKAYLNSDAPDPREHWAEIVAEREAFVEEIQQKISGYPEPVKQQFNMMVTAGQQGHWIQEDHNWWIDQQGNHQVRQVFLEFGNRLAAAGVIANRSDIFMLTGDEIIETAKSGYTGDFKSAVLEREAEMEKWAKITAAPHVGTNYGPPPDNPITRALSRLFGWGAPIEQGPSGTVAGRPGSAGKVTGTARIIVKLNEAGKLSKGDILVTPTTSPPWTPLFATAGGIVTDTGGALSHCAIVAREYGIPAVVGATGATLTIKDGDEIEVDGDTGKVRIL